MTTTTDYTDLKDVIERLVKIPPNSYSQLAMLVREAYTAGRERGENGRDAVTAVLRAKIEVYEKLVDKLLAQQRGAFRSDF